MPAASLLKFILDELDQALSSSNQPLPLPQKIAELTALPAQLQNLQISTDDWSKVEALISALKNLADPDLGVSLLYRILERHLPRVAAVLIFVGVVEPQFDSDTLIVHRLQWTRLMQLLTQPEQLLNYWKSKIQTLNDLRLQQIYVPTVAYAANSFLVLEHKHLGFSALPVGDPPPPEQQAMIDGLIHSPIQLLFPTTFPLELTLPDAPPFVVGGSFLTAVAAANADWSIDSTGTPNNVNGDLTKIHLATKVKADAPFLKSDHSLGNGWSFHSESTVTGELVLEWNGTKWTSTATAASDDYFKLSISKGAAATPAFSLGDTKSLLLEIGAATLFAAVRATAIGAFKVGVEAKGLRVQVNPPGLKLLSGVSELQATTDVRIEYVLGKGIQIQSQSGDGKSFSLSFLTPLNRTIGSAAAALTIGTLRTQIDLAPDPPAPSVAKGLLARMQLTIDARGKLGPVDLVADGFGAWFGRWRDGSKLEYVGLVPPQGIGARLQAGPIGGGGFMKMERLGEKGWRIGGALSLKLTTIGIGALGLIEEGPDGTSFVVVLGIRFTPGIQLTFGFELTGVGGLVGLNRRADCDALKERLASGAAGNVLFCSDPVRDGPGLLGDLAAMFPACRGSFIVAPTLQLAWISPIIRLDLGLLIEVPALKILIVGSARALIGTEDAALVNLRLDFLGGADLAKKEIFFDASLVNSSVLGFLKITGDAAFRLTFGDTPDVVLSIGGFHPRFNPESLHLRTLARAAATLAVNAGPVDIWLRQEAYFAFTTNTLQLGGRTEASMEVGPLGAHGFMSLDAFVQFKPFSFEITYAAGFEITFEGEGFGGVRVEGMITGPGPLVISARATLEIPILPDIHGSATFRLGPNKPDRIEPVSTLTIRNQLKTAIALPENMKAGGEDRQVQIRPDETAGTESSKRLALLSPRGTLIWTQKLTPLSLPLVRYRGQPLEISTVVEVKPTTVAATDEARELFSLGQFANLNDSQMLNNPGMDPQRAGWTFGLRESVEFVDSPMQQIADPAEVKIQRLPKRLPIALMINGGLMLNAVHNSMLGDRLGTPTVSGGPARVKLPERQWHTYSTTGGLLATNLGAAEAFLRTQANTQFAVPADTKPVDASALWS